MSATADKVSTTVGVSPVRGSDSLEARAREAWRALEHCQLCERRCGVNRLKREPAPCRLGAETYIVRRYVSYTEKGVLIPALRVYLGGCSFRCRFCNSAPECFEPNFGEKVVPERLADELVTAVAGGTKAINLLGGEPSLHVHTILELAVAAETPLPLVLNTNGYMTPTVIDLLGGVVSVHLVDFKFGNDRCAQRLAGVPRYVEVVRRNLRHLAPKGNLVVLHLLMPGHLDCCFKPVVAWLSDHLPGCRFELMTGYVPGWQAETDTTLGVLNHREVIRAAIDYLKTLNLYWRTDGYG